ncbi:MAG: hypothetical protein HGB19_04810 [Chlorobiales bacterium]|nr:hypothetical protein [Chlorobiales bacterium]
MKAVWLTDIHLNFLEQKKLDAFLKALSGEQEDCFFISGDIAEADGVIKYLKQISVALKRSVDLNDFRCIDELNVGSC